MNAIARKSLAVITWVVAAAGCASYPLPLQAQLGSTVAIAVAGESSEGLNLAYGSFAYEQNGITDDQRGRLVFTLHDPATGAAVDTLDPVVVTRVAADPSSTQAMVPLGAGLFAGQAQALALVDVPDDPGLIGTWELRVTREDRDGNPVSGPRYRQPITILSSVGAPNPLVGFFPKLFGSGVVERDLLAAGDFALLYPHPKAVFNKPAGARAGRIVLSYNTARIDQILAVFEEQHPGRDGLVIWAQDSPNPGELEVQFVDPKDEVLSLAVVFALKDPDAAGIVELSQDFTVLTESYYDADGAALAGALSHAVIR